MMISVKYLLRALAVVLVVAAAVSCGRRGKTERENRPSRSEPKPGKAVEFVKPVPGRYYRLTADDREFFIWVDGYDDSGTGSGHFYAVADTVADRHSFRAVFGKRTVTVTADGAAVGAELPLEAIHFSPYVTPSFIPGDLNVYRKLYLKDTVNRDVRYGSAQGYWTSLEGAEKEVIKIFTKGYVKSFRKTDQELTLDLYRPLNDVSGRPLILFIHGGAFYIGNKEEPAYVDFCRHFADMGYVTASINYRLGFHLSKNEIERAGYVALQDAHAALRFLVAHADEYGIDPSRIFVAGSSAGGITALNLAFMQDDVRPNSTRGKKAFLKNKADLGDIASSGNDLQTTFHIAAIASMWGAVSDLSLLENSRTSVLTFHGEDDNVVPYGEGYPLAAAGERMAKLLSEEMYGSACIDKKAAELGLRHKFYSFPGEGHALNTTGKDKQPNENHTFIKDRMTVFFFDEMVPQKAVLRSDGPGYYYVDGPDSLSDIQWKVDGGFILSIPSPECIHVLWCSDQPHKLTATGTYGNEIGWMVSD